LFVNDNSLNGRLDVSFFLPGNSSAAADTSVFYNGSQSRLLYKIADAPSLTTNLSGETDVTATRTTTNLNYIIEDIDPNDDQDENNGGDFAFYGYDGSAV